MSVLPRPLNKDETILVKLKCMISMKNHVAFQPVRPLKVLDAARWLVSNSTLFKNEGISFDGDWLIRLENQDQNLHGHENSNLDTGDEISDATVNTKYKYILKQAKCPSSRF